MYIGMESIRCIKLKKKGIIIKKKEKRNKRKGKLKKIKELMRIKKE
jgi:hypothetical protein